MPQLRESLVREFLDAPVEDFLSRGGKGLRSLLVTRAAEAADPHFLERPASSSALHIANRIIEKIHAGSLIIDDIQDGSAIRRKCPTFHRRYGIPLAINAGNSLYFKALDEVPTLGLPPEREILAYRMAVSCMARAHEGQSIDLGVRVGALKQEEISPTARLASESKTGALMECSAGFGFLVSSAPVGPRFVALRAYGVKLGIALQICDDLAHYERSRNQELPRETRFEDLRQERCTWLWAMASDHLNPRQFRRFRELALRHPGCAELGEIVDRHELIRQGVALTCDILATALTDLTGTREWNPAAVASLLDLQTRMIAHFGLGAWVK